MIVRIYVLLFALSISACSCNKVFFYPQKKLLLTPDQLGVDFETVKIKSKDILLHNWLLKPKSSVQARILYLHGNAENISTHIRSIYWLVDEGYEILMLDYRGFGQSQGKPCLPEILHDIEQSYNWLVSMNNNDVPIFIIGQSLGASLAAYSVGANPDWYLSGLILDAPFASYRDIVREKLGQFKLTWLFQYPISLMIGDDLSPIYNIERISPRPLLMFYSDADKVVPRHNSQVLFERAGQPKKLIITQERHVGTFLRQQHRQTLLHFLQSDNTRTQFKYK